MVVPAVLPVIMPEDEPALATAGTLLVQAPPELSSVNVVLEPAHKMVS